MGVLEPGGELSLQSYPGHEFEFQTASGSRRRRMIGEQGEHMVDPLLYIVPGFRVKVDCHMRNRDSEEEKKTIRINVEPGWSPRGAKRFLELVEGGFYDGVAMNR